MLRHILQTLKFVRGMYQSVCDIFLIVLPPNRAFDELRPAYVTISSTLIRLLYVLIVINESRQNRTMRNNNANMCSESCELRYRKGKLKTFD